MNERRITPSHQGDDKLKAIAGLVKKLSFLEMTELAEMVGREVETASLDATGVARALLRISDEILARPEPTSKPLSDVRFAR